MMQRIKKIMIAIAFAWIAPQTATAQKWDNPLTSEEAILQAELEWAEHAMEGYKRKTGKLPIRSSIRAAHVHTEAWRQDSIDVVQGRSREWNEDSFASSKLLRGAY